MLFQLTTKLDSVGVVIQRDTRDLAIEAAQARADLLGCSVSVMLWGGHAGSHVYLGSCNPELRASRAGDCSAPEWVRAESCERITGGPHEVAEQYHSEPEQLPTR